MRVGLALAFCVCAACASQPRIPPAPVDLASVAYGNSGSITGGGQRVEIYANDQVYLQTTSLGPGPGRASWQQLPPGSYDALRAVAASGLTTLRGVDVAQNCMNAGTDFLEIKDAAATVDPFTSMCPDSRVQSVFSTLNQELVARRAQADQGPVIDEL